MSGDKNYLVYGDNTEPVLVEGETIRPPSGEGYADTLKFSHVVRGTVYNCLIDGGYEDAIDMNRGCSAILISGSKLNSGGKYVVTIKDSSGVTISDCVVGVHGTETDIDLGNWTDTSTNATKNVTIKNVTSQDGRPVRVRVGHANWPKIVGGNAKIDYIASYLLKLYWWGKYLWTKIKK